MQKQMVIFSLLVFMGYAVADEIPDLQTTAEIQMRIDGAQPGDEIVVDAGEYHGVISIKDGVTLVGAGDGRTVINGGGAAEVVAFGKESALVGFTVKNGQVLAANQGNFIGVFECSFEEYTRYALQFQGGSGVAAHNIFKGNKRSVAIYCYSANPLIIHNLIEDNAVGFQWHFHMIPTLLGNLFRNNTLAIGGAAGATIVMRGNLFDGNQTVASFGPLPPGNEIRSVSANEFIISRGRSTATYRDLMDATYSEIIADHPIIVYDLSDHTGNFDAITLFPWATFTVSASAIDTVIASYEAYDWVADRTLNAEYVKDSDQRPSVRVNNPDIVEKMRERYVLENHYVHPASYFDDEQGRRIFRRMTNVAQIEVLIPRGYRVVSSAPEAVSLTAGDRTYLSMHDIGNTHIEIIMVPANAP